MSADRNPVDYQNMDYNIWEELYIRNLLVLDNLVRQFIINFDNWFIAIYAKHLLVSDSQILIAAFL